MSSWSEIWHLALESLRANKLRATLTMLGVIIGSACIVLVVTVALTGSRYINGQIEAIGSNVIHASLEQGNTATTVTPADQISLADMDAVQQQIPQVIHVAGTNDFSMTVVAGNRAIPVGMIGVTQQFQDIRRLIILRGRYFDDDDFASVSKVCVVSEHLAQEALDGSPVGKTLHVGDLSFTVIGVFRERQSTFGQSEIRQDSVLVPFPIIRYYTGSEYIVTLYAQADNREDVPLVTKEVAEILKSRHRPEVTYSVENLSSILETAQNIARAMTIVLLFVAALALLISGIGIMNIMLVSVTERTREIGIRKALGARQKEILWQFLLEAILISGIGAAVGIAIAVSMRFAAETALQLAQVPTIVIPISPLSVLVAFTVSCATGILFGYLPANKAARLQPVESLRQE
ncbi:MAG TPA: ABC transporter permease [Candidatus Aquilonibacter sp.]|nr:ABC transporter permease [Candidatus Aquilonibacter sp.]